MRAALLVGVASVVVYLGALRCGFVYDDHLVIERNRVVQAGSLREIVAGEYWGTIAPFAQSRGYRPLAILTLRADFALWGLRPAGFHATNMALHALVSVLVLLLARRIGMSERMAVAAALLFAAHALHTEAVTGIVGRAELLAAAGVLGALLLHDGRRAPWAAAAFAAGLLAKENAVAFPALALCADALAGRRPRVAAYAAYAGVIVAFLAARVLVTGALVPTGRVLPLDNPLAHVGAGERLVTATAVLGRYAWLLLAPLRLSADYALGAIPVGRVDGWFALGALWTFGAVACAWIVRRKSPVASFALAILAIAFVPIANLVIPIHTIMGERLAYLPSVGFCLLAGLLLGRPGRAWGLAIALVAGAHAVRVHARNRDWRDDVALFTAARAVAPGSARVANNYGNVLKLRGDLGAAMAEYRRAATTYPDYVDAWRNLTMTLAELRQPREAALAAMEGARALLRLGHADLARQAAAEARRLDPALDVTEMFR